MLPLPHLENFNLKEWMEANRGDWGRRKIRVILESPDYITLVGRGPSLGREFHIGAGDEIFYQLEGNLHFYYMTSQGERKLMVLRPGEMFLLPARVPHSPQRADDSVWTLVVERGRRPGDVDSWVWYCDKCDHKIYETPPRIAAGPTNAPDVPVEEANKALRADQKLRTCGDCGEVLLIPS